ncbi:hypothetical protein [Sulfurovum sp. AR]|uniref:hypothetical protein n=1 Tax=Sulfurovum sp. AR TaxID=1165841 RepID=UPI00025C4CBE|nr:hypothetical protein [Sulfurovum sp. AR]EIF51366.1 hypothetical protein SULAR_03942 [Sulfurovum sp. AR]
MKQQFNEYGKGKYLGSGEDMAKHKFDAYRVNDEIHIVYESGNVATQNIHEVKDNMDKYLWTPYVMFV